METTIPTNASIETNTEAASLDRQEHESTEDTCLKYSKQLRNIIDFAVENHELDAYVDACIRELSWIAVSRNHSTVIISDFLSKLSWCIVEQTRYIDAQAELARVKQNGEPLQ